MKANSIVARLRCGDGTTLKQSGDLRHPAAGGHRRRHQLGDGRSSSKDMSRTMTTDFRMVASLRKGSRPVACAAEQKTACCTTLLLTALLGCSGVFSGYLVVCMGIVEVGTGRYRGHLD
jgi:hypothetical protein